MCLAFRLSSELRYKLNIHLSGIDACSGLFVRIKLGDLDYRDYIEK